MSIAQRLVNLSDGLSADGILSAAKGGTGTTTGAGTSTPTISAINYGGDDTATNPAGGATITLTGTNFASGARVLINQTPVGVVTVVSATQITFTAPALSAGSYILYVVNLDGSTAIAVPGIQYSGTPAWTTAAGTLGTSYETAPVSTTVAATSDSTVTYSVVSGTLPSGVTINASGTVSGTSPIVSGSTTYTFTVRATDLELQDTDRQFSLTINPDVVTWSSSSTVALEQNAASTTTLSATSAAGQTVSYSVDTLPAGLTLSGATVSGTATAGGTTTTIATATAAVTGKTAQQTITWTVSIAADAYFKYTTLLLNAETVVAPFLADASANNFSLTAFGDTKPSNYSPYTPGYYSNYWNGSSSRLTPANAASNDLSTGDWTIEGWVNQTTRDGGQYDSFFMYDQNSGFNAGMYMTIGAASFTFLVANAAKNGWSVYIDVGTANLPALNTWAHIAITRSGSTFTVWVNGVSKGTATYGGAINTRTGSIFQVGYSGTADSYFHGYISNFRVVKGTAVYTSAFTPPTQPLTAVTGTALLLCNSNRRIDASGNNTTVTWDGDASTMPVTSFNPFQPNSSYATYGSTYFDGSGDYVTYTGGSTTTLSADFTLECWVYLNNLSANQPIICIGDGYNLGALFFIDTAGKLRLYANNVQILTGTGTAVANTWNHVAFVRSGTTVTAYLNGVAGGTATSSSQWSGTTTYIGREIYNTGAGIQLAGYLTDLRLVKGTAVYTTSFTPPTQPLTAVTNTSLLTCQTNQPHTNSQFLDNSTSALQITRTGNATQGAFSPYGANWSNYFDGSGDWIATPSGTTTAMGDGFAGNIISFEAWIYPLNFNSGSYSQAIISSYAAVAANGRWLIDIGKTANSTTTITFGYTTSTGSQASCTSSTSPINLNQWNHIAVTVDATSSSNATIKLFANGILLNTFTAQNMSTHTSYYGNPLIGGANSMYVSEFNGYISNFRVLKGAFAYTSNYTVPVEPLQPTANTVILTCQSPSIVDNSVNNLALSKSGDVSVQRFSPFATVTQTPITHSVYFDGTGDYIVSPATAANQLTGDFTVECWFNMTGYINGMGGLIGMGGTTSSNSTGVTIYPETNGKLAFKVTDTLGIVYSTTVITTGVWYHVALVRSGTTNTLYLNGVAEATNTATPTWTATPTISIGKAWLESAYTNFNGYISNVRIVKGTAIYTANFTPSTQPLTAVAGTYLLTCQEPTVRDNSTTQLTLTTYGDTKPVRQNPFGYTTSSAQDYTTAVFGGSAYFDGTGDYLNVPANAVFAPTGDFSIMFWCYIYPTASGYIHPMGNYTANVTSDWMFEINMPSGTLYVYNSGGATQVNSSGTIKAGQWAHLAMIRSGTTVTTYLNGVNIGTRTQSGTFGSASKVITIGGTGSAGDFLGYISDVTFVSGTALYTSNFVPPSAPLQAVQNTTLLLNMDKSAISDKSGKAVAETVGDAKVSTSVRKYGTSSLYFDGTGDYLTFPSNPQYAFGTGDFTIECWVNSADVSPSQRGFLQTSATAGGFQTSYTSGITFLFGAGASGGSAVSLNGGVVSNIAGTYVGSSTAVITANTWTHLALVRSNGTATMYVNGVSVGSATATGNCTGTNLVVGGYYSTGYVYGGYIDDLRITKGYARYTANFTPPQQALLTK